MPILCELRRRFPDSKIAWVVGQGAADVIRGHEDLDDLFVLSKNDLASPLAYIRFLNKVRTWRPDTLIDAQGLTKSAWIGRYSGAKLRIGLSKSEFEGRELSTWLNNTLVTPSRNHVVLRGLELLKPLGIEDPLVQYKVPRFRETIQSVDQSSLNYELPALGGSSTSVLVGHRRYGLPIAMQQSQSIWGSVGDYPAGSLGAEPTKARSPRSSNKPAMVGPK